MTQYEDLVHANSIHQAWAALLSCDANSCSGKVLRLMRQPSFAALCRVLVKSIASLCNKGCVHKQLMLYLGPVSGGLLVLLDCSLVDNSPSPNSHMVVLWEHPAVEVR